MNCNCKHEKVCKYKRQIWDAINPLMPIVFGSRHNWWHLVEELIQKICQFREAKEK